MKINLNNNLPLCNAKLNTVYTVNHVLGTDKLSRRLCDLGFTRGAEVFVMAISLKKGTVLVNVRGNMIALRDDAARKIILEANK